MVTAPALTWSLVATPRRFRIRVVALTVCGMMCCVDALRSAPSDYEGKNVGDITFDPATQPLTAPQLMAMLPLKAGQPLRSEDVRASIQRLYATGEYADIAVDATLQNGNVNLRFITTPAFFVGYIGAEGVPEPPNRGQIITATKLQLGAPYSEQDVHEATESIT